MPACHKHRFNKRQTTVTIPERVGLHVKLVFAEMKRQNKTYDAVEEGSGVRRAALKAWRHKNRPSLESIEAALGFLGYDFVPIPRSKVLPAEVVAELQPIAERLALDMPATVQALLAITTGIHSRFASGPVMPEAEEAA
jgi:transcriptional regulator with XRE-family HTH domain